MEVCTYTIEWICQRAAFYSDKGIFNWSGTYTK